MDRFTIGGLIKRVLLSTRLYLAERQGFEPWSGVNLNTISSRAPSASSAISPNKVLNYAKAILYKCMCNVNDIA